MSNDIIPDWTITSNTHLLRNSGGMEDGRMEVREMEGWRMEEWRLEVGGVSGADGGLKDNSKA